MKFTFPCTCGKNITYIKQEDSDCSTYLFRCDCGKQIIVSKNHSQLRTLEKYKVKINPDYNNEFEKLLKEMKLEYKVTHYTKSLMIWGVFISTNEDIEKIKKLSYVTSFEIMPIVTLS